MKKHNYLICPMCGKRSMFKNFFSGMIHKFKVYVNEFGGRGHCVWYEKDLSFDEERRINEEIRDVIKYLAARFNVNVERVAYTHSVVNVPYRSSVSGPKPYASVKVPVKAKAVIKYV